MYERKVDRAHPNLFVFMIDQSGSMANGIAGTTTPKAEALCQVLNRLFVELVMKCMKEEGPRHYFDVALLGYGGASHDPNVSHVRSAFGGSLVGRELVSIVELATNPLRVDQEQTSDGAVKSPIWVDPRSNGCTPMCGAFALAHKISGDWSAQHPDSFPPVVFNVSDGSSTDGDPRGWAAKLREMSTSDGNLLLFNIALSGVAEQPVFFPSPGVRFLDEYASLLFDMSSELPPFMREVAAARGNAVSSGARGFVFNASAEAVIDAMMVGTGTRMGDGG